MQGLGLIVRPGYDASFAYHYRPDGYLSLGFSFPGLLQGFRHESAVMLCLCRHVAFLPSCCVSSVLAIAGMCHRLMRRANIMTICQKGLTGIHFVLSSSAN